MLFRLTLFVIAVVGGYAQSTEGAIIGVVKDEVGGQGLEGVQITAVHRDTGEHFQTVTSFGGSYVLLRLAPGLYDLSAELNSYRPARIEHLDLPVTGLVHQNVSLRRYSDLFQRNLLKSVVARDQKTVLMFYGPDVDMSRSLAIEEAGTTRGSLEPSISQTVDPQVIDEVPLAGRDAYQLLTLMPGVASGLATLRGVSVAVNGQRPSSSSFLLDGVENNNYLVTGPLITLPPEAVEQYRVSTNNFSAEYGRTSGYVANTVTYSGSNELHGLAFLYGNNEVLNANELGRPTGGLPRLPTRDWEGGFRVTGPLLKNRLFYSLVFDGLQMFNRDDPTSYLVPGAPLIAQVTAAPSRQLLAYGPPAGGTLNSDGTQTVALQRPHTLNQLSGIARIDWVASSSQRLTLTLNTVGQSVPGFIWSPYPAFNSALSQNNQSLIGTYLKNFSPSTSLQLWAAVSKDRIEWGRAHNELPKISISDNDGLLLPGSPENLSFFNRGLSGDIHGNIVHSSGRHIFKFGGGTLLRGIRGNVPVIGAEPELTFSNWQTFAAGEPENVTLPGTLNAVASNQYEAPDMLRDYRYAQPFGFIDDNFRVSSRLLLYWGARYDLFTVPKNVGAAKDTLLELGSGADLNDRIMTSHLATGGPGPQSLYSGDHNDWAGRLGLAWNLSPSGSWILRAAYGDYYDRPFDNLWIDLRFNNALPVQAAVDHPLTSFSTSSLALLANGQPLNPSFPNYSLTLYQPGIRTPYVHSFFIGLQRQLSSSTLFEVNYAGSSGHRLITTDRVNRECASGVERCGSNPILATYIDYRANQGNSAYNALMATLTIRKKQANARLNYTWSHAIDDQSDPLAGLLNNNLEIANFVGGAVSPKTAGFTQEFNPSADRGNADFDQRQSLTGFFVWNIPSGSLGRWSGLFKNWNAAALGAIRSGTPYTIYASGSYPTLLYNRASQVLPDQQFSGAGPAPGGRQLLNPAAFADPQPATRIGNLGRNAFAGPAFYGLDFSLARSFRVSLGDRAGYLQLRADAYNALNHSNLNNPNVDDGSAFVGNSNFGFANYGRSSESGGPLQLLPLAETRRQIQLALRFSF